MEKKSIGDEFRISYSISNYEINDKNDKTQFSRLKWIPQNTSFDSYVDTFKTNKAISHIFKNNTKRKEDLINFQFVAFDIDDSDIPMEKYLQILKLKPSLAYTTNNNLIKGYRFRLIYCLDTPYQPNYYSTIYSIFSKELLVLKDECTKSPNQCILGNGKSNISMVVNDFVFSFTNEELDANFVQGTQGIKNNDNKKGIKGINNINNTPNTIKCDDTFLKNYTMDDLKNDSMYSDFNNYSFEDFVDKYQDVYRGMDIKMESDLIRHDERYYEYGENYAKVIRKFVWVEKRCYLGKWLDGEQRRKKLFLAGRVFLQLNPDLSLGDLLFLLTKEMLFYYSNKDGVFTKQLICQKVIDCFNSDFQVKTPHSAYKVDKKYCEKNDIKPKQLVPKIRKEKHYIEIGELYDANASDKENLLTMQKCGVKCSMATLKRFKRENNLTKKSGRPRKNKVPKDRE